MHYSHTNTNPPQVYIGKLGNAYFYQSILAGQTDFLYGFGTAWIQSSALQLRGCGGGITAWKGTNTTTPNKYGVYIVDSSVRVTSVLGLGGWEAYSTPLKVFGDVEWVDWGVVRGTD